MGLSRSLSNKILKTRLKAYDFIQYARELRLASLQGGASQSVEIAPALTPASKIAIVAIRPTPESRFSTLNLLHALHENGYKILIGSDGGVEGDFKRGLDRLAVHYLMRRPIGRDFGVYRDACFLLQKSGMLDACDCLLLANDSMYYPKSVGELVRKAEEGCETWASLFECFQDHYHAQSFFLLFKKKAFLHQHFSKFWAGYRSYNIRKHAVRKGEFELSSRLVDAVGYPYCVFSSSHLGRRLSCLETEELMDLVVLLANLGNYNEFVIENIFEPLIRWKAAFGSIELGLKINAVEVAYRSIIITALCRLAETTNPTHSIGLVLNRVFGAPVKRDLGWRGTYALADIVRQVRGFEKEELDMIAADLRRRGLPASVVGFSRHLYKKGRI